MRRARSKACPSCRKCSKSCGETFRVQRCVEKTCVDGLPSRRFPGDAVVILDGPRCDGAAHDGCKHGCRIFWKEAWLEPSAGDGALLKDPKAGLEELRARLKVKSDEQRYYCQSTELYKSTEAFPDAGRRLLFRVAFKEMQNGDLPLGEFLRLFARWIWQRVQRRMGADDRLRGPHKSGGSEADRLATTRRSPSHVDLAKIHLRS